MNGIGIVTWRWAAFDLLTIHQKEDGLSDRVKPGVMKTGENKTVDEGGLLKFNSNGFILVDLRCVLRVRVISSLMC